MNKFKNSKDPTSSIEKKTVKTKSNNKAPSPQTRCESCEFYDYDEDSDSYCCTVGLDQDEYEKFMSFTDFSCRYYRFYDEYKTVQKQN